MTDHDTDQRAQRVRQGVRAAMDGYYDDQRKKAATGRRRRWRPVYFGRPKAETPEPPAKVSGVDEIEMPTDLESHERFLEDLALEKRDVEEDANFGWAEPPADVEGG
jgi:hypothetical protein